MKPTKRELTTASNKQAILKALLERMQKEEFNEIKISDLCEQASISQASFYNYFPQKTDILLYYIQLWLVEMFWVNTVSRKLSGLEAIERLFEDMAEVCISQPKLLTEIISLQVRTKKLNHLNSLSIADKQVAFPNYECVDKIVVEDLGALLLLNIQQAIRNEELPMNSDVTTLIVALSSIFFSVPILFSQGTLAEIKTAYKNQLNLIMHGAVTSSSQVIKLNK